MSDYSSILFARGSFFEGMGRVMDIGDTLAEYNVSPTEADADRYALWADWRAVCEDLRRAVATPPAKLLTKKPR